ncbi:MAG: TlpA family protein disulfide reductase [Bdellovibrio sp.]|nr:TlpA family protein disulfide reductase [Bdellovibrio sp.]
MTQKKSILLQFWLPLVILLLVILGALLFIKHQIPNTTLNNQHVHIGDQVTDFSLKQFNFEKKSHFFSELKAKVALINFFASWCESCMLEIPALIKLRSLYQNKGFELILVNLDEKPEAVLPKFINNFEINFPIYIDTTGKLGVFFNVQAIPTTVILDKNRKILLLETGDRNWESVKTRVFLEKALSFAN